MDSRREALLTEFLSDAPAGSRVLEIGSGTGRLLAALAGARPDLDFVGIEPLPKYVSYAQERVGSAGHDNIRIVQGTADSPSGVGVSGMHRVISVDVLHHVEDQSVAARNVTEATEASAQWLLVEPNALNLYMFAFCLLTTGERNFWPRRFLRVAGAHGWRQLDRGHRFLIPASVKQPKAWMTRAEALLEDLPVAGAAVTMTLERL